MVYLHMAMADNVTKNFKSTLLLAINCCEKNNERTRHIGKNLTEWYEIMSLGLLQQCLSVLVFFAQ